MIQVLLLCLAVAFAEPTGDHAIAAEIQLIESELRAEAALVASTGLGKEFKICKSSKSKFAWKRQEAPALQWLFRLLERMLPGYENKPEQGVTFMLSGEASIRSVVGISGALGIGIEAVRNRATRLIDYHLFFCLLGGVSVGAGAGIDASIKFQIGFGKYDDSIADANFNLGGAAGAGVVVGGGVLMNLRKSMISCAKYKWDQYAAQTQDGGFKRAVTMVKFLAREFFAGIRGVQFSVGVGASVNFDVPVFSVSEPEDYFERLAKSTTAFVKDLVTKAPENLKACERDLVDSVLAADYSDDIKVELTKNTWAAKEKKDPKKPSVFKRIAGKFFGTKKAEVVEDTTTPPSPCPAVITDVTDTPFDHTAPLPSGMAPMPLLFGGGP